MMKPVKNGKRNYFSFPFLFSLCFSLFWNFLFDPLVWSRLVEILNALRVFDHPIQVTLAQEQHVIEARLRVSARFPGTVRRLRWLWVRDRAFLGSQFCFPRPRE
jgi:hypothetical protein